MGHFSHQEAQARRFRLSLLKQALQDPLEKIADGPGDFPRQQGVAPDEYQAASRQRNAQPHPFRGLNPQLYLLLSQGRTEFLLDHVNFEKDMREAQEKLEGMM